MKKKVRMIIINLMVCLKRNNMLVKHLAQPSAHSQFYQDSNHHGNRNHVLKKKKKKQLRQKENLLTHRTWVSRTTTTRNSQTIRAILLLSRSSVFCVLALFFLIFFIRLQIYPSRYKNHGTSNFWFNVNVFLIHP